MFQGEIQIISSAAFVRYHGEFLISKVRLAVGRASKFCAVAGERNYRQDQQEFTGRTDLSAGAVFFPRPTRSSWEILLILSGLPFYFSARHLSAVSDRRSLRSLLRPRLKRPWPEEEFHNVPFVRLQPVELDCRDRPQVQAINVRRIQELSLEPLV